MHENVKKLIEKIRPFLQADGGDVELVEITDDNVVKVRLQGACSHCPMATLTLKRNVEAVIKKEIPEVKEVVAV